MKQKIDYIQTRIGLLCLAGVLIVIGLIIEDKVVACIGGGCFGYSVSAILIALEDIKKGKI